MKEQLQSPNSAIIDDFALANRMATARNEFQPMANELRTEIVDHLGNPDSNIQGLLQVFNFNQYRADAAEHWAEVQHSNPPSDDFINKANSNHIFIDFGHRLCTPEDVVRLQNTGKRFSSNPILGRLSFMDHHDHNARILANIEVGIVWPAQKLIASENWLLPETSGASNNPFELLTDVGKVADGLDEIISSIYQSLNARLDDGLSLECGVIADELEAAGKDATSENVAVHMLESHEFNQLKAIRSSTISLASLRKIVRDDQLRQLHEAEQVIKHIVPVLDDIRSGAASQYKESNQ